MTGVRVLHATETLVGGVATYLNILLRDQVQRYGADNVALFCPRAHRHHLAADLGECIAVYDTDLGRNASGMLALAHSLRRVDRHFAPSLVHLHSSFAGALGRVALPQAPRRVIYNPHGWSYTMTTLQAWQVRLYAALERQLLRRCAAVIAVSRTEHEEAVRAGLAPARIHTVLSGLPALSETPPRVETSARIQLVFAGRATAQKGLDWLMQVMRQLEDVALDLRVFGADAAQCGEVPDNVRVLGWRSAEDLTVALSQADALVMPSRWEAFGFSAVEAMRLGVAVLASTRGALPELVVDGHTGVLFSLDQPETLMQVLRGTSRETYRAWGRAGQARFHECFEARLMCRGVDQVYRDVVAAQATGNGLANVR